LSIVLETNGGGRVKDEKWPLNCRAGQQSSVALWNEICAALERLSTKPHALFRLSIVVSASQ
jgi:hypothetical protein